MFPTHDPRAALGLALVTPLLIGLAACAPMQTTGSSQVMSCEQLREVAVPRTAIGLPTTGAHVISATVVAAAGAGANAIGEYCKVLGSIAPVDPAAPDIRFELDLPTTWNSKIMMFGGGGYNGTIRSPAARAPAGATDKPSPLGLGYATFHSDSGHQASGALVGLHSVLNGAFGVNDEALKNFAGDALKKTRDTALHLVKLRYGKAPSKSYFAGGSTGGREALAAIQRWPADWDGAIAVYPAPTAAMHMMQMGRMTRALAAPGGYLSAPKRALVYDASIAACDALDGVKDGIVSNVAACKFDPRTIRCADGRDGGDQCLSDTQIATLNTFDSALELRYPVASNETGYPGFNAWAGGDHVGVNPVAVFLSLGAAPPQHPAVMNMPFYSQFYAQWVQYFVTRDPSFNALQFDPENPGKYQQRVSEVAGLTDVNNADLSAFERRGGKLIMLHGQADMLVSPRATADYYQRVVAKMGQRSVDGFMRYYEIPGYAHVFGKAFNASYDSVGTLENWVEKGVAPANQTVADTNAATAGRTRPMCDYPGWPKYKGSGDASSAASFTCAR